jgi:excisionase family DNA binding protein
MGKMKLSDLDFVSIQDTSNYCGVCTITVRRWIDSGKLHAVRLPSGHRRIAVQDLLYFLKQYHLPIPKELSLNN